MRLVVVCLLVVGAAAPVGHAGAITQDPCPGTVSVTTWKQLDNDLLENLLFSDGSLWVSDSSAGAIRRFDPSGNEIATIPLASPGAMVRSPDGYIYANYGDDAGGALERSGGAGVVRFLPADPQHVHTYASGLDMANGLALGGDGSLYVSDDVDDALVVVPPGDPSTWHRLTNVWGTNGLVIDPVTNTLYANITFDQRSPIERIPLANPSAHSTFAQLSFGVASLQPNVYTNPDPGAPLLGVKGLDDITRGEDGALYPVANGTGELLRVDQSGAACLIASGFGNPTSVRIASQEFRAPGDGASTIDFFVTQWSGAISRVRYTP